MSSNLVIFVYFIVLNNFYQNHLKFDIINKFNYFLLLKIPQIKKIILTVDFKNFHFLSINILLLKFICKKNKY